jgi:hypothetical protein
MFIIIISTCAVSQKYLKLSLSIQLWSNQFYKIISIQNQVYQIFTQTLMSTQTWKKETFSCNFQKL